MLNLFIKRKNIQPDSGLHILIRYGMQITIIKTLDGMKYYVYLLTDNFSRFILSWRIEEVVSGRIRVETIREAYKKI